MSVFRSADILFPRSVDMAAWSVIACDQFTSDKEYWNRVRETIGQKPSTLHMILPEAELGSDRRQAAASMQEVMHQYLTDDVFMQLKDSYIYVERTLENGTVRPGLIGMLDLEAYDYHPGSVSVVRATEETVLERIPPRQEIRMDAELEFPHILMLCDDHDGCLIEPIEAVKDTLSVLYDFDLMEGGGHITGWLLDKAQVDAFDSRFAEYAETYQDKYKDLAGEKVLLAAGDGNHSLATAKSCYEALKARNPGADLSNHPARYALVELENIHHPSQRFEPIHRILFHVDCDAVLNMLRKYETADGHPIQFFTADKCGEIRIDKKLGELAIAALQPLLDNYFSGHSGEIDYIHGEKELIALTKQDNAIGFILPPMEKDTFFRGIISKGVLPRKTFSMGHAREKRYYLEGRRIK